MDGSRFDSLTRAFTISRRSTIRTFLGGAMGALITFRGGEEAAAGCKKVGKKCDKSKDCCDGAKCKGGKKGKCKCKSGRDDCDGDGKCESLDEDDANCGACGVACATGEACCEATCIDVENNRANCGSCGAVCGDPEICASGACVLCLPAAPRCGDTCCPSDNCNNGTCQPCPVGFAPCPPNIPLDCCEVTPL
jgi:hypothetical protein